MRRAVAALALSCLAFLPGRRAGAQARPIAVPLPGYDEPVRLDTGGVARELAAPGAAALAAAARVLADLGLPVAVSDSAAGLVGNLQLTARRSLAGQAMAHWFDCGTGQFGPVANSYRIRLAVLVSVRALAPDRSRVTAAVAAGAEEPGGTRVNPAPCTSTRALENNLLDLIAARATTGH